MPPFCPDGCRRDCGKTTVLRLQPSLRNGGSSARASRCLRLPAKRACGLANKPASLSGTRTLAQTLKQYQRYDGNIGRYFADPAAPLVDKVTTCIVDEASMLTEDQLAALVDALPVSTRLIFVGDQGSCRRSAPEGRSSTSLRIWSMKVEALAWPSLLCVGVTPRPGLRRRESAILPAPTAQLADLFSGRDLPPGEDEILERVLAGKQDDRLRTVRWKSPSDLRPTLDRVLMEELAPSQRRYGEGAKHLRSRRQREQSRICVFQSGPVADCRASEEWQILTPSSQSVKRVARLKSPYQDVLSQQYLEVCAKLK